MTTTPSRTRWWRRLFVWGVLPIGLGVAGGWVLHRYREGRFVHEFVPYRTISLEAPPERRQAYSYLATPTDVEFGEIESYRRYEMEWQIVNTGLQPLDLETESATCELMLDQQPLTRSQIQPNSYATIRLRWMADSSSPTFEHSARLRTNDGVPERRKMSFRVSGTVNPLIEVRPPVFDVRPGGEGEPAAARGRVACYSTKAFEIVDGSFSDPAMAEVFSLQVQRVSEIVAEPGERVPAVLYDVIVRANSPAVALPAEAAVVLRTNLPEYEPLRIPLSGAGSR